jgi:nicotinamide riboside kinase
VKKTVDLFIRDRLIASYPVVVTVVERPTDEDYVDQGKRHMQRHHSRSDIQAAKFVVRS